MAADTNSESIERLLVASFSRVNDWLRFAEAKNAALLTFCSAWIVALASLEFQVNTLPSVFQYTFAVSILALVVSAVLAIVSFLPRTALEEFFAPVDRTERQLNLLFYGDIKSLELKEFAERVTDRYQARGGGASENYLNDLAVQIHVNSQIASRKFLLFDIGARIVLVVFIILLIAAAAHLIRIH